MGNLFVDYTDKINLHVQSLEESQAVNAMIIFFNHAFMEKNNFFVADFNVKNVKYVQVTYNQVKSNILSNDESVKIFDNISVANLKLLKFILTNLKYNYQAYAEYLQPIINREQISILIRLMVVALDKSIISAQTR